MLESDSHAEEMVDTQIRARGISDPRVLAAMKRVPRTAFVKDTGSVNPYGDYPLSIGHGQTISQPYMVAIMTEKLLLEGNEKVLEIGTGSGYQTAVLAELVSSVYTIERIGKLIERSKTCLSDLGYGNIRFRTGDGSLGWSEEAPFDRILITAAVPRIPSSLKTQLADRGILVAPVGDYRHFQVLNILRRSGSRFEIQEGIGCRFVPLLGEEGF